MGRQIKTWGKREMDRLTAPAPPAEDKALIKSLLDAFIPRRQLEQLVAK
jgi:hypothetical protein